MSNDTLVIDVPVYRIKYRFKLPWLYGARVKFKEFTIYDEDHLIYTQKTKFTFKSSDISEGEVVLSPDLQSSFENLKDLFQ